jgi:hypothetical protein
MLRAQGPEASHNTMRPARMRFTIGSMMVATAILGLLTWVITGLLTDGAAWFSHPPLYMVIAYPFLFAASLTLFVTIVQFRSERRPARGDRTMPNHARTETAQIRRDDSYSTVEPSNTRPLGPLRPRFTILSLMFAIAVVGFLLSLGVWGLAAIVLPIPLVVPFVGNWLAAHGRRRAAAFWFWGLAVLFNLVYAALCICPDIYLILGLEGIWFVVVAPPLLSFGVAWAFLATRRTAVPRRSPLAAWLSVAVLTVLPVLAPVSLWPFHLAFWAARPTLEVLADQVAAGQSVRFPRWAGLFRLAEARVDSASGNVGLLIEPNPNHPAGLVRLCPGNPPNYAGPIGGSDLSLHLGGAWWYREDD